MTTLAVPTDIDHYLAAAPVFVERAMYFGYGGHDSAGVNAPSRQWFLPDGSSQDGTDTWVLIMNPNPETVTARLSFFTYAGLAATQEMKASTLELMRRLEPRDFELLVDLVFTTSGWRRVGLVGKTQTTLDLTLPSTGERALVHVTSNSTSQELAEYVAALEDSPFDRMFYVFHSGEAATDDLRVTVIGPEQLADLVVDAGLVGWLIRKAS